MKRLKILLVTPLLIGIFTLSSHAQCKSFKVEAKVTDTVGGGSNGSVELDIPDMSRIKGLSILAQGIAPDSIAAPLLLSAVLAVVGVAAFDRRDLR
jgi:hypothetical protein